MNRQSMIPAALRRNDLGALRAILTAPAGVDLLAPVITRESVTLRKHDSINLTTGAVTLSDGREASQSSFHQQIANAMGRNSLRALHVAIMETTCAWTAEACHRSQAAHGRVNDCPTHQV